MRYARIRITGMALMEMLKTGRRLEVIDGLPKDAKFVRVFMEPADQFYSVPQIWLMYESMENGEVPEGCMTMEMPAPTIRDLKRRKTTHLQAE